MLLKLQLWLCSNNCKLRLEEWQLSNLFRRQAWLLCQDKKDSKVRQMHFWLIRLKVSLELTFFKSLKGPPTRFMSRGFLQMQLKEKWLTFLDLLQDSSLLDWYQETKMLKSNLIKLNLRLKVSCSNLFSTSLRISRLQMIWKLQRISKKMEPKQIKSSELCCVSQISKIPCKLPFALTPYR